MRCVRCGALLRQRNPHSLEWTLALALGGLVFFILATALPFLTFELNGRLQVNTLAAGAWELGARGLWELGALVLVTSMLAPLIHLLGLIWLLLPLVLGRRPWQGVRVFRLVAEWGRWGMMEVYMLGVLVAFVKLGQMAQVETGSAFFAFAALMVIISATRTVLDPEELWQRLRPLAPLPAGLREDIRCRHCGLTWSAAAGRCPRCRAVLHRRIPASLERSWALLLAAAICYIPANLLPIMTVIRLGRGHPDTILSGVESLIQSGLWPLAAIVFFASILVPVLKLAVMAGLLLSVGRGWSTRLRERTVLYRFTETIGRWSMIDIYMISILVALVKLGNVATVEPGPGAVFFAAVVILTMLAAEQFDPRLIWDRARPSGKEARHG